VIVGGADQLPASALKGTTALQSDLKLMKAGDSVGNTYAVLVRRGVVILVFGEPVLAAGHLYHDCFP